MQLDPPLMAQSQQLKPITEAKRMVWLMDFQRRIGKEFSLGNQAANSVNRWLVLSLLFSGDYKAMSWISKDTLDADLL